MPKTFFFLVAMLVGIASAWAQAEDSSAVRGVRLHPELSQPIEAGPLLTPRKLERQPIYQSLERALTEPQKVYKLDLGGQKLREVPADVFRLVNLQSLDLSDNKLRELPPEVAKLQNLQVLNLTDNKLRTLPEQIREMKNLTRLYLGENRIMEMPAWVGGLGKLRYVDLHGNYITLYEVEKLRSVLRNCEIGY